MSANNHTPIATGAEAAAQIINAPLGQLDASLGDLDSLDTVAKTDWYLLSMNLIRKTK
jgi:hypothetical protein